MPTRRKFIRDCALVAAASALAPVAFAQDIFSSPAFLGSPRYDQFLREVNTPFVLHTGEGSIEVILAQANILPASPAGAMDAGNEKFSLLFRIPARAGLEQGIYSVEHQRLGRLSVFIVPVGGSINAHRHYEAVFNRPVSADAYAEQLAQAPRRIQQPSNLA